MKSVFCVSKYISPDDMDIISDGYYELYRVFSTEEKAKNFVNNDKGTYHIEEFALE